MKKNFMMRAASVLLVAVMLTTCAISGTFAKYVTSDNATDSARVAKFGVVVTAGGYLFDETYKTTTNVPGQGAADTDGVVLSVESNGGVPSKVVAPGTLNNDGLTFSITGQPEVDVAISVVATTTNNDIVLKNPGNKIADMTTGNATDVFELANDYYPVQYTLWHEGVAVTGAENVNLETLIGKINAISAPHVDANTNLTTTYGNYKITWKWAYEDGQTLNGKTFDADTVDKADTVLGDLAALMTVNYDKNGNDEIDAGDEALAAAYYNLLTDLTVTVTVEQID